MKNKKKNKNDEDPKIKIKNQVENIEILLRLYCCEEEIKGKIENYDKIKGEQINLCIMDKKLIDDYKNDLQYDIFIKNIKDNEKLFDCIKDKNGIINSDDLNENNNLLIIINQLKKENSQIVYEINNIDIEIKKFEKKSSQIKCKKSDKMKLPFVDEFYCINLETFNLIIDQLSLKSNDDLCQINIGKNYIFFLMYINIPGHNTKIIQEIGEFDYKNNNFKIEYVFNFNNKIRDNLDNIGVDNFIDIIKKEDKNENMCIIENEKIYYYQISNNKAKIINNEINKKSKNKTKNFFIDDKDNPVLKRLLFLYCYYSDMFKKIYSNKDNNIISEKAFLVNSRAFLDIKIDLNYKILKDELDHNEPIQKLIIKDTLQTIDPNAIIKLLPPNYINDYKKKKINIDKNTNIEPVILTKNIQNQFGEIMIFDDFEILDEELLFKFFKTNFIKQDQLKVEYSCVEGRIIITLPEYLNKDKYFITLIGFQEDETYIFRTSHILIYYNKQDQINHLDYIKNNDINLYLDSLKEEYNNIIYEGKIIGLAIKLKIQTEDLNIKIGLENIGATCYMNATLQCFAHIKEFVRFFKEGKQKLDVISNKNTLSYSFNILINKLWPKYYTKKTKTYYAPYEFKEKISKMNPLFKGVAANDSKDLINFIVMTLHDELNTINNNINIPNVILDQSNKQIMFNTFVQDFKLKYNSLASDLFYGMNYNITKCTECGIQLYNYQVYFFLIFPLEEVRKFVYQNNFQFNQFNQVNNNVVDIYQCMEFDRRICLMSGDNAMFCNICKRSTNCNICTNLSFGPNILIIILNRGKGIEFNVKLNFYEDLNLSNYIEITNTGVNYKLIGVITHLGESGMSGHFIAFCKDPYNQKWYKFNDAFVSPVTNFKEEVIDYAMPYLLFYQKENI